MKTYKLACIIVIALFFAVIYPATCAEKEKPIQKIVPEAFTDPAKPSTLFLSVEALGAVRSINIGDGEQYGVGVDVGLRFNKWVAAHLRAIGYESPDEWRGSMIDEGSALIEATILTSANGRFVLSGLGGADYNVDLDGTGEDDFGFSVGPRIAFVLHKNVSIVADSRIRAWFNATEKDIITTAGIRFSF